MCEKGFHFSSHPFDALTYAPGSILCKVLLGGEIVQETDKGVASARMIVKRLNFEDQLFFFARWQALKVIKNWKAPDVVKKFLLTGDKSLRDAAWSAARAAAEAAAWSAEAAAGSAEAAAGSAARSEFLQLVEKEFS